MGGEAVESGPAEPEPAGEPRCIRTVRNGGYMYIPAA